MVFIHYRLEHYISKSRGIRESSKGNIKNDMMGLLLISVAIFTQQRKKHFI